MAACIVAIAAAPARGQDANATYDNWTQLEESRRTKEYRESLRETGVFDEDIRVFLQQIALPQLSRQKNRPTIERTRRRIREVLLDFIPDEKILDEANRTVLGFMEPLARDGKAEPIVRVNAALLVGELQDANRGPWPPAAQPLAGMASDRKLPMAVRIAALVGIARHVEASKGGDAAARLEAIEPSICAIIAEAAASGSAAGARSVEDDWLAARAATILAAMKGSISKETAAGLSKLLNDPGRRLDVRIRAAQTLGGTADTSSQIDTATTIASIRALAVEGLERDLATVDRRRLDEEHRGLSSGGQTPATDPRTPVQTCRRAVWRLSTLADALVTEGNTPRGLALLAGDGRKAAEALAADLRQAGRTLDGQPDEQSLEEAYALLAPQSAAGRAGAGQPAAERPAQAEPKPAELPPSPFETSPFGN